MKKLNKLKFLGAALLATTIAASSTLVAVSCSSSDQQPSSNQCVDQSAHSLYVKKIFITSNSNRLNEGEALNVKVEPVVINGSQSDLKNFQLEYQISDENEPSGWKTIHTSNTSWEHTYTQKVDGSYQNKTIRVLYKDSSLKEPIISNEIQLFIDLTKITSINSSILLPNNYNTISVNDVNNQQLKEIIIREKSLIFQDLPDSFNDGTDLNVSINEIFPSKGYIEATITLNKYYDQNSNLVSNQKPLVQTVIFKNFKCEDLSTKLSSNNIFNISKISNLSNNIASAIDNNNIYLKDFLLKNAFVNIPSSSSVSTFVINNYDNLKGELVISSISIQNYFNQDGKEISELKTFSESITIVGFKKVKPTIVTKDNYDISNIESLKNKNVDQVSDIDIKNLLIEHKSEFFENLVDDVESANINDYLKVSITNRLCFDGTINVNIELSRYFDDTGKEVSSTSHPLTHTVIISGFKSVDKSTFITNPELSVSGTLANYIPSKIPANDQYLKTFIFDNMIKNTPVDFSIDNILSFDIINTNNLNGSIIVSNIKLNNYYDNNYVEMHNEKIFSGSYTINGFKTVQMTAIKNNITIDSSDPLAQKVSTSITVDELKQYILNHKEQIIINPPSNLVSDNISVEIIGAKPFDQQIMANIKLNNYIDANGDIIDNGSSILSQQVIFNGFKQEKLNTYVEFDNSNVDGKLAQMIPTDLNWNDSNLKQFVINHMLKRLPVDFAIDNITSIKLNNQNALRGTIDIESITINKSFDNNGDITTQEVEFKGSWTLNGFKKSNVPTNLYINNDDVFIKLQQHLNDKVANMNYDQFMNYLKTDEFKNFFNGLFTDYQFYSDFIDYSRIGISNFDKSTNYIYLVIPFKEITIKDNRKILDANEKTYDTFLNSFVIKINKETNFTFDSNAGVQYINSLIKDETNFYKIYKIINANLGNILTRSGIDSGLLIKNNSFKWDYYKNSQDNTDTLIISIFLFSSNTPYVTYQINIKNFIESLNYKNEIINSEVVELIKQILLSSKSLNDFSRKVLTKEKEILNLLKIDSNKNNISYVKIESNFNTNEFPTIKIELSNFDYTYNEKTILIMDISSNNQDKNFLKNTIINNFDKDEYIWFNFNDEFLNEIHKITEYDLIPTKWRGKESEYNSFIETKYSEIFSVVKKYIKENTWTELYLYNCGYDNFYYKLSMILKFSKSKIFIYDNNLNSINKIINCIDSEYNSNNNTDPIIIFENYVLTNNVIKLNSQQTNEIYHYFDILKSVDNIYDYYNNLNIIRKKINDFFTIQLGLENISCEFSFQNNNGYYFKITLIKNFGQSSFEYYCFELENTNDLFFKTGNHDNPSLWINISGIKNIKQPDFFSRWTPLVKALESIATKSLSLIDFKSNLSQLFDSEIKNTILKTLGINNIYLTDKMLEYDIRTAIDQKILCIYFPIVFNFNESKNIKFDYRYFTYNDDKDLNSIISNSYFYNGGINNIQNLFCLYSMRILIPINWNN